MGRFNSQHKRAQLELSKRVEAQATRATPLYDLAELHGTGKTKPFDERSPEPVVLAHEPNSQSTPAMDVLTDAAPLAAVSMVEDRAQRQTTRRIARDHGSLCCDRQEDAPVRGSRCC